MSLCKTRHLCSRRSSLYGNSAPNSFVFCEMKVYWVNVEGQYCVLTKFLHVESVSTLRFISSCLQWSKGILLSLYLNILYICISQKSILDDARSVVPCFTVQDANICWDLYHTTVPEEMDWEVLQHPSYNLYLAVSDLHLCGSVQDSVGDQKFELDCRSHSMSIISYRGLKKLLCSWICEACMVIERMCGIQGGFMRVEK